MVYVLIFAMKIANVSNGGFLAFLSILILLRLKGSNSDSNDNNDDLSHIGGYKVWPKACFGLRQSPINIELRKATRAVTMSSLKQYHYDVMPIWMGIINDGHSIMLVGGWPAGKWPYMEGGILSEQYVFDHIVFRWNSKNDKGSEHTLNGVRSSMELHLVHIKKTYGNYRNAFNQSDGIATISVLYNANQRAKENQALKSITKNFVKVDDPNERILIQPFVLSALNGNLKKQCYVAYKGSLTNPPCSQSVYWMVSTDIEDITREQLKAFHEIELRNGDTANNRPIQSLGDRKTFHICR